MGWKVRGGVVEVGGRGENFMDIFISSHTAVSVRRGVNASSNKEREECDSLGHLEQITEELTY